MTMQLVRGMSSLNTKKRKQPKKTQALLRAEAEHEKFLKKMGVTGKKTKSREKLERASAPTKLPTNVTMSNSIPGNGCAKEQMRYTGYEIAGIVVTHKSNLMPIRKDNKTAAKDAAAMRR